MNLYIF